MAGHSRPKDGVASACLCPAIHVLFDQPQRRGCLGIADKFTQPAQGRLLRPGMTEVTLCRSFDGSFAAAQDAAQDIGNGTVFAAPKRQPAKT
jgi:hypothetical protein